MAGITHEIDDKNIVMAIKSDAVAATKELVEAAGLKKGQILVGCLITFSFFFFSGVIALFP